jgi:hypothetical protein
MDERFYKKLDSDPTEEFSTKITQELKIMKEKQTILDVYNCFTCIVSLYRNDPTPRKIDR